MRESELRRLLEEGIDEIYMLRRRNEVLQGQVDTMNLFAQALRSTAHSPNLGFSEDVAHKMSMAAMKLESAL